MTEQIVANNKEDLLVFKLGKLLRWAVCFNRGEDGRKVKS